MGRTVYSDYDFEEAYQKQIDTLEDWEVEQVIRKKKLGMVYMTKTTKAGNQMELDIYPAFGSRHDLPRGKKKKASREAQKSLNGRRAKRKLINLINANFGKGDLYCTFTYDDDHLPEGPEDARKIFGNFIKRVNRLRKKQGRENVKYIFVTEYNNDEKGIRCHHHAVMSGDMDRDDLEKLWRHGKRNQTRRIEPDKNTHLTGMATYLAKDPKGKKRWGYSKGLKKPKVTKALGKFSKKRVERMAKDYEYLKEQAEKRYPGYCFIDSESRVNEVDGGLYIFVRMVRN